MTKPNEPDLRTKNRQSRKRLNRVLFFVSALMLVLAWNWLHGRVPAWRSKPQEQFHKFYLSVAGSIDASVRMLLKDQLPADDQKAGERFSATNTTYQCKDDRAVILANYQVGSKIAAYMRFDYQYDGRNWRFASGVLSVDNKVIPLPEASIDRSLLSDAPNTPKRI